MKKIVVTYGLIAGAVMAALMCATLPFQDQLSHGSAAYVVGYTTMIASMLLVYFGVRSYRETIGGGTIGFGRALGVGLLIMLIACVLYVVAWEIVYHAFMPDFMDRYSAAMIAKAQASGMTGAALQAKIAEIQRMNAMYSNPLVNVLMTFMEPLPVGLVMAFVSAALLRRKKPVDASGNLVEA